MNKQNQNQNQKVADLQVIQTKQAMDAAMMSVSYSGNAIVPDTDKDNLDEMSLEQLNEYIVNRSAVMREYVKKKRTGFYASDMIPPICHIDVPLKGNIENVLACFSNTLAAALFSESQYIKIHKDFETLSSIVESEQCLIFDFLSKNGLMEKFNKFVNLNKKSPKKKNDFTIMGLNVRSYARDVAKKSENP